MVMGLKGLVLLMARIYRNAYVATGQNVAITADQIEMSTGHSWWFQTVDIVSIEAVHGIHGLGSLLVVIAAQWWWRSASFDSAITDLLRLMGNRWLLGKPCRWPTQGRFLKFTAQFIFNFPIQTDDTLRATVFGQWTVLGSPSNLRMLNSISVRCL